MKELFQIILLTVILSNGYLKAQQFHFEWARSFGGSKSEFNRIMKVDKTGDVYVFSETNSHEFSIENKFHFKWINPEYNPSNAVLLKYSSSGQLLWGRALKTNGGIVADGIAIDQDNNIVLSGLNLGDHLYLDTIKIYANANFNYIAFLIKLDDDGKFLNYQTFKSYGGSFYNQGGISIDKAGNYYMTAKTKKSIINKQGDTIFMADLIKESYLLLLKLNNDFNPIWIKKYYNIDGYFSDVTVDDEDNILIYGEFRGRELLVDSFTIRNAETVYLQGDIGENEVYLLKVNSNGQAIWLEVINGKDDDYGSKNDLTLDGDMNIYLGGIFGSDTLVFNEQITLYKYKNQLNYYDIFYMKYDKSGNCVWARSIMNGIDPIDNMSIHVLPSGHLIVSGNFTNQDFYSGTTTLKSNGKADCFVLLARNNGEIMSGFSFGGNQNEYDGQLSSDGKSLYILSSFGSSLLQFGNVIVKNDTTDGSLDCLLLKYSIDSLTSTTELSKDQIDVGLYPNPAKEMVRLQLPEDLSQGLIYYNLYDINGNWISSGLLRSNHTEVSVQALKPGNYIVKGGVFGGKRFVNRFVKME